MEESFHLELHICLHGLLLNSAVTLNNLLFQFISPLSFLVCVFLPASHFFLSKLENGLSLLSVFKEVKKFKSFIDMQFNI